MRLYSHFPAIGVSNTYIIGPENGGPAVLIDPGRFDVTLLELIEANNYDIKTVLVTHDHENHVKGLRTLLKVYDARIVAGSKNIYGFESTPVSDGAELDITGISVTVIDVEGHSSDSRVFKIGPYIFTGDVLSAGRIGTSPTTYTRKLMIESLHRKILSLDENLLILPGHGPPTTIAAEKKWNPDLLRRANSEDLTQE